MGMGLSKIDVDDLYAAEGSHKKDFTFCPSRRRPGLCDPDVTAVFAHASTLEITNLFLSEPSGI